MKVINNVPLLRAMAKEGCITLHPDTGQKVRHWTGQLVTATYVRGSSNSKFTYNGKKYCLKYFDGCFCPFVVLVENPQQKLPDFV